MNKKFLEDLKKELLEVTVDLLIFMGIVPVMFIVRSMLGVWLKDTDIGIQRADILIILIISAYITNKIAKRIDVK